jgi:1-hydroxycarotenoid 3,4-desaturase
VARIETDRGRASGVILASGERIAADRVVFNGDAGALSAGLLGADAARATAPAPRRRRSLSALVWSATAETRGFPLSHHTIFFGPDYRTEFGDIFDRRRLARHATTYVCAQDRDAADGPAPMGPERLHIQVNAPADGDIADNDNLSEREIARCREETMALMARAGLEVELTPWNSRLTTPRGFAALFPGTGGALYGEATHGPFASFGRPSARTRIPGLYLAGGSTHPGAGVPMAALSGRLAAEALTADLEAEASWNRVLTVLSPREAMPGGMSTPSRRTGSTG